MIPTLEISITPHFWFWGWSSTGRLDGSSVELGPSICGDGRSAFGGVVGRDLRTRLPEARNRVVSTLSCPKKYRNHLPPSLSCPCRQLCYSGLVIFSACFLIHCLLLVLIQLSRTPRQWVTNLALRLARRPRRRQQRGRATATATARSRRRMESSRAFSASSPNRPLSRKQMH